MVLQKLPVRIGLGDVTSDDEAFPMFPNNDGNMRGERTLAGAGNQDGERVRAHKCERSRAVFDAKMFGYVHVPFGSSPTLTRRNRGSQKILWIPL